MERLSDNSISDVTEGTVKGILNWTKEQIVLLAQKFRNRDIAFIQDQDTITTIKEQLKTGEWDIYKRYVHNNYFRVQIQMGLALRKFDHCGEFDKIKNLKEKIFSRFGEAGIHISQFVQSGMFSFFLGSVLNNSHSVNELESVILEILENIDKYVVFIQEGDSIETRKEEIKVRIYSHAPKTFIICSKKSAIPCAQEIIELLKQSLSGYSFKDYKKDEEENIFLLTKNPEVFC